MRDAASTSLTLVRTFSDMTRKKKIKHHSWEPCDICAGYFTIKHDNITDEKHEIKPPFIRNHILTGCLYYDDEPLYSSSCIYLSPRTMEILNLRTNDFIFICSAKVLLRVFPREIEDACVIVPSGFTFSNLIQLTPATAVCEIKSAECLLYKAHPQPSNLNLFNIHISQMFANTIFVNFNSSITIKYLGVVHTITLLSALMNDNTNENAYEIKAAKSSQTSEIFVSAAAEYEYFRSCRWLHAFTDFNVDWQKHSSLRVYFSKIQRAILNPLRSKTKVRSFLLYGPSGCGKTTLAKAICNEFNSVLPIVWLSSAPVRFIPPASLIVIDPVTNFNTATLAKLFKKGKQIVVLGIADDKRETVAASLRSCDCFHIEIEIPLPNPKARRSFLIMNNVNSRELESTVASTSGYSFSDLLLLLRECEHTSISSAIKLTRPSVIRDVVVEVPTVKWEDIGGLHKLKKQLMQMLVWPFTRAHVFELLGIRAPHGVLLYGPPGCSKTLICRAIANECNLNFLAVAGPELFSKWVGDSEKAVREIFRKAHQSSPSIIFFDEIDALTRERNSNHDSSGVSDRVVAQMLTELDGLTGRMDEVVVVAATNRPDVIDRALLRPGRFDRLIYVPLPDAQTREEIFNIQFKRMRISDDVCMKRLVESTEMFSGAEVVSLCNEAGIVALKENLNADVICSRHFTQALQFVFPKTTAESLKTFEIFSKSSVFI